MPTNAKLLVALGRHLRLRTWPLASKARHLEACTVGRSTNEGDRRSGSTGLGVPSEAKLAAKGGC